MTQFEVRSTPLNLSAMSKSCMCVLSLLILSAVVGPMAVPFRQFNAAVSWSTACEIAEGTHLGQEKIQVSFNGVDTITLEAISDAAPMPDYAADDVSRPWMSSDCLTAITHVEIGYGVTSIGENAFRGLAYLAQVTLNGTTELVKIGAGAFFGCDKLAAIELPQVTMIGLSAFESCIALASAKFAAATEFGERAFFDCQALTTLQFDALLKIGKSTFEKCVGMTSFTGGAVTDIGDRAFVGDSLLATVSLSKVVTMGQLAFQTCIALPSVQMDALTTAGLQCFFGCTELTTVSFPKLTNVTQASFEGCVKLATVTLTEAVEMGGRVFYGCTALSTITVDKVAKMGRNGFAHSGLTSITFGAELQAVPESLCDTCSQLTTVKFNDPPKVTEIGLLAFAATKIASIEIPRSIKTVSNDAFKDCTSLTSVTYNGNVALENNFFEGCTALKVSGITLGTAYRSLIFGGFSLCESVGSEENFKYSLPKGERTLTLSGAPMPQWTVQKQIPWENCRTIIDKIVFADDKVTAISARAFSNHLALKEVTLPATITKIPDSAFDGCLNLQSIVLHDDITEIGNYAFRNCASLSGEFLVPLKATSISESVFQNCAMLTALKFGVANPSTDLSKSSLTYIGNLAFAACSMLSYVELPPKLKTIGSSGFLNTAIKSIVIPASVVDIGKDCFRGCKSLTEFQYLGTTPITNNIFADIQPHITVPSDYPSDEFGGKKLNDKPVFSISSEALAGVVLGVIVVGSILLVVILLAVTGRLSCKKRVGNA